MTISTSEISTESTRSVHMTSLGNLFDPQDCFFFSMFRLQMGVRRRDPSPFSQSILATGRPTVPNPIRATRQVEVCSVSFRPWFLLLAEFAAGFEVCLGKESLAPKIESLIIRATCASRKLQSAG